MEVFCRKCGAEIPEGSSFCGRCGTPVEEKPAVSEERKNEPPVVGGQSKGRKPLIIGVCSGVLLLAVGIATLFATGAFGGRDEPEEIVAKAEKPVEEVKEPKQKGMVQEQKEPEPETSPEGMANEAFEAYKAYIREKGYDEEGRYSYCLFYLDDDDYPELSIRFESGSTYDRYRLYVFKDGEITETGFIGMDQFGMYKERAGYLYDVLYHTGTVSCNVGILKGTSVEMLAEETYDSHNEEGEEIGAAFEEGFRERFGISDGEWRHTTDHDTLEEAFGQLGPDGAENGNADGKTDWRQIYVNALEAEEISGYEQGYAFNDINSDGIPELFIHAGSHSDFMLYVKEDGSVDGVSVQYYNGTMLYGHSEWYNPPEGELYDTVYQYDENGDTYKSVEGKKLRQKQDEIENTYFIDDNEVSEQEYNARLEEIESMGWKDGQTSEYDAEHYGCQTEDIIRAVTEYQEPSQTIQTENEMDDSEAADIDVEAEVAQIREWYYDTQEKLDTLSYMEREDGISCYYKMEYVIKGIIPSDYGSIGRTREYFYNNESKLYFAFLYSGEEEYRVYFKDGEVVRYVDSAGEVYDYGNIPEEAKQLGRDIISESNEVFPPANI